eukprot:scaffold37261_cov28-Tisochrysis_lutea.AAC.1
MHARTHAPGEQLLQAAPVGHQLLRAAQVKHALEDHRPIFCQLPYLLPTLRPSLCATGHAREHARTIWTDRGTRQ